VSCQADGCPDDLIRVRLRWSEIITSEAARDLDAARIRRLGYDPQDPDSVRRYLQDADNFDGGDWYPWHSEFSEHARRIDADNAEISSVIIEGAAHPQAEGVAVKYTVYAKRPEVIVYAIEAGSPEEAGERYLTDGEETGSYLDGDTEVTVEPAAVPRGQCEFCHAADAALTAVLAADPDQAVCGACHADPRLPTVSLAAVSDSRPVYVVSRGDLARIAGREVTDTEAARIAGAIGNSTASEAIGDAVVQVCGYPAEPDESD
jgi:predicted CXXCH cytochrome family protein